MAGERDVGTPPWAANALVNLRHTSDRTKQVIYRLVRKAVDRGGRFVRRMAGFSKRPETHEFDSTGMRMGSARMLVRQGVGTCAALARDAGVSVAQLDIRKLQSILRESDVDGEDVPEGK